MLILPTSQPHTTRTNLVHKFPTPKRHQNPEQVKAIQSIFTTAPVGFYRMNVGKKRIIVKLSDPQ